MQLRSALIRWTGSAADAVTTAAVVGGMILVPALGWQNARLRSQRAEDVSAATERANEGLRRAIELSQIEGTRLPERLIQRMLAVEQNGNGAGRGLLVVAFMPNVCGVSLRAGLESLREAGWWRRDDVALYAFVGEQSRSDRASALALRQAGLLTFPVAFVPAEELYAALFSHMRGEFAREPLYLRLDGDFRILTAFQADQDRPELLDQWLAAIAR